MSVEELTPATETPMSNELPALKASTPTLVISGLLHPVSKMAVPVLAELEMRLMPMTRRPVHEVNEKTPVAEVVCLMLDAPDPAPTMLTPGAELRERSCVIID